jgi:hypothetical protein
MDRNVRWAVMGCCVASLACVLVLRFHMGTDPGLSIYSSSPFTGWGSLAAMLRATGNVSCSNATGWPRNASGLQPLLDAAWCTAGFWPSGLAPTNRSAACACVTAAWDGLVQAACAQAGQLAGRPSPEALSQSAGQVVGCMGLTPPYQTFRMGDLLAGVLPTGLALYCNGVVFLATASFLLFFHVGMPTFWVGAVMGVLCALVGVLLVYQATGQALVLPTLVVSLGSVLLGLHYEREAGSGRAVTDELEICSYALLPQLLPAYALLASVAGFARDAGACGTSMALGLFIGVGLQGLRLGARTRTGESERLLGGEQDSFWDSTKGAVYNSSLVCLGAHWMHLLAVSVVYFDPDSPYLLSKAWPWILLALLLAIGVVCAVDARRIFDPPGGPPRQGLATCQVLAALVAGNVLLTGLACRDALLA